MFRVVELFSGIGSQARALSNVCDNYEIVNTAEWDINAILAYCMIHKGKIDTDKYKDISDEEISIFLKSKNLSTDGKSQIMENGVDKMPLYLKRLIYTAIKETSNLVNIMDVHWQDIPDNVDLMTYSFPCQDLSLCGYWHGNKSGISRDAHNRSGMLWEVERILLEMKKEGKPLPKFLLMENVCNILSKTHEKDFNDWKSTLESLGYFNKVYRLNAKNFGIPQKRERAYMISVLCKNSLQESDLKKFFLENDLEEIKTSVNGMTFKKELKDILCLDYTNPLYKFEADSCKPNDTPSRQKIYEENDILFDGKCFNEINVNTITTKQDRNPNSGLVVYKNYARGKAKWRYLTPRECFKLMGFPEQDYDQAIKFNELLPNNKKFITKDKLYKMAGNSIVVNVLEALFKQIIDIRAIIWMENL